MNLIPTDPASWEVGLGGPGSQQQVPGTVGETKLLDPVCGTVHRGQGIRAWTTKVASRVPRSQEGRW